MHLRPWVRLALVVMALGSSVAFAADPNQPATTSGGLYSLDSFPLTEIERTLTMTRGVFEVRPELRFDLTKDQTFDTWKVLLGARYGLQDTIELQAGTDLTLSAPDGAEKPKSIFAAVEFALKYDLVDARFGVELPLDPDFLLDIVAGLPVRIRINKQIAIVALEKIVTIHTIKREGQDLQKPDLTVSVGGLFQLLDQLAVIVRGTIIVPEFSDRAVVPVQIDLQYSVANILDVGVSAVLGNLNAKDPAKPFDSRFANLFVRFRFGQ